MKIKVLFKKTLEGATLPKYNHDTDAGIDFFAAENVSLKKGERILVNTGVAWKIEEKMEPLERFFRWAINEKNKYLLKIEDTSGNAFKRGLKTMGGVIDQDYRGDIKILLYNTSKETVEISIGDKIAQGIVHKLPWCTIEETNSLDDTVRGSHGFGSSSGLVGEKK